MPKGIVKFYNSEKSFGFIKVQGQKDVFFHKSALPQGLIVDQGANVEFDIVETTKGKAAENIVKC